MAFLHVMRQITLLLCHISSIVKSRSFGTLICVLISFWILSFYSRIVQCFSPKLSHKVKLPSPPKSPPRLLASPPYILESLVSDGRRPGISAVLLYGFCCHNCLSCRCSRFVKLINCFAALRTFGKHALFICTIHLKKIFNPTIQVISLILIEISKYPRSGIQGRRFQPDYYPA